MDNAHEELPLEYLSLENCRQIQCFQYTAIYFLRQDLEVVYVGKSENVIARIGHQLADKPLGSVDSILIMPVPKELLDRVERYWIETLQPIWNKQGSSLDAHPAPSIYSNGVKRTSFTIPKNLLPHLNQLAQENGRTRSAFVSWLVRKDIERLGL